MTDEFVQMLKDILDRAGLGISVEQIEAGLNAMTDDKPKEDPWLKEVIRKIEEERKKNPTDNDDSKGCSMKDWDGCYVVSGPAIVEYHGRTDKKYEGDAVLILKPDHSLVVHGLRGVNPVSYMVRAEGIWSRGSNGTFTVEASTGDDRLLITFRKMCAFESLFREHSPGSSKPLSRSQVTEQPSGQKVMLTDEEKALETRLKKLRIDLAHEHGFNFLPAVFDNQSLYALVRQRPATKEDLKKVKGFGEKRIEKYGDSVLQAIHETVAAS